MNKDENKMIKEMDRFPIYAGCSIIGEDEIGIKKSELARLKNLEINYEQVYEDYRKLEQERKSCRIIADDEMVVKKSEYEKLSKDYATINNDAYYCGLSVGRDETAREILQEFLKAFVLYTCVGDYYTEIEIYNKIEELAKEYGVDLEGLDEQRRNEND